MFGGLGVQELLIVFIIALILFGGKKLPEVGHNLGKALRSFRQAEEETRKELEEAVKEPPPEEGKPEKAAEAGKKEAAGETSEPESKEGADA